nr:hypothetical protein [Tanacetum cinerariifolium]
MLSCISFHVLYGRSFKTLCLLNYALMKRHDYDITVFFTKRGVTKMNQENRMWTPKLYPWIITLMLKDLPHKINQTVNKVVKDAVHVALQAPIRDCFRELPEADMKKILHQRMFKSGSYRSHPKHVTKYKALEASMECANRDEFLTEKDKSPKDCPQSEQPINDVPTPDDVYFLDSEDTDASHLPKPINDVPTPDDVYFLDSEDTDASHLPKVILANDLPKHVNNWAYALANTYKHHEENKLLRKTGDMGSFNKWYCRQIGKKKLNKADLEGLAFKTVKAFHGNNITLKFQMEECHLILTDQVDLVNPEGHRVVPDVSKPLPLGGSPGQAEGFYITRHSAFSDRRAVRSHLQILCVISLKTYERYGYTYLKEIVLHRAGYKEQRMEELQLGIESYQTKLNLTQLSWDASHFLFKEDYTIIPKPRAIIYRDRNDQKKMKRENKVHKFSDDTLKRVLEKLDHMVKDFRLFKYNPEMENRIWYDDDKKRSKEFMVVNKRRLKIRKIF